MAAKPKDPRAVELGEWLQKWRRKRGLNRPETVAAMLKQDPRVKITTDHLAKIEYGNRSLASLGPDTREALRLTLAISAETWEEDTGLLTLTPDVPPPLTDAERRGWTMPPEVEPEIPDTLLEAAKLYGHGKNAPLAERRWLLELAELDFREEPESPEDWLAIYVRLSKLIDPK